MARLIAPKLSTALGQQVVVENRPGAGGIVGAEAVAKSAPDGYTLVVSTVGSHGIGPTLNRNIKYDAVADFTHIALIGAVPHVLLVNPKLPAKTFAELIALAREQPGKINYGSGGSGSINHVTGELLKAKWGFNMVHVPYKGSGPALTDLRGFTIPVAVDALPANLLLIRSGELRALGITSPVRSPLAPDVPTFCVATRRRRLSRYRVLAAFRAALGQERLDERRTGMSRFDVLHSLAHDLGEVDPPAVAN